MTMKSKIGLDLIQSFLEKVLEEYSIGEPSEKAEKVATVVYDMLVERDLVQEHANQTFVDVLIAAALMHDVFETDDWTFVYESRYRFPVIAEEVGLPDQIQDAIYEAIEAQLGTKMPVTKCRPQPGTPQETFAYAVWFVKQYLLEREQ